MKLAWISSFPMTYRSLLLVAPDSDTALDRAAASGADALIVDGSGADDAMLRRALAFLCGARGSAIFVQPGPLAAARTTTVLDALIPAQPTGVVLARPTSGADVTRLSALLRPREAIAGLADGSTTIIAMAADTPASLLALATYAGASRRLVGLAWDDRPLAQALNAEDPRELARQARTATLLAAAAAGVAAFDRPCRGGDKAALQSEAKAARRAGFAGKLATAADQVAIINPAFSRTAGTSS